MSPLAWCPPPRAADRINCDSALHQSKMRWAVLGLLAYPIGIPLVFVALLYYNGVPQLARAKVRDGWLREVANHAVDIGAVQASEETSLVTCETAPAELVVRRATPAVTTGVSCADQLPIS